MLASWPDTQIRRRSSEMSRPMALQSQRIQASRLQPVHYFSQFLSDQFRHRRPGSARPCNEIAVTQWQRNVIHWGMLQPAGLNLRNCDHGS
jgi:hypothetical protein